jgi:hypothetical protein
MSRPLKPTRSTVHRKLHSWTCLPFLQFFGGGIYAPDPSTYDPIEILLNAETEDERDELTAKWRDNKLSELNFVGVVVSTERSFPPVSTKTIYQAPRPQPSCIQYSPHPMQPTSAMPKSNITYRSVTSSLTPLGRLASRRSHLYGQLALDSALGRTVSLAYSHNMVLRDCPFSVQPTYRR